MARKKVSLSNLQKAWLDRVVKELHVKRGRTIHDIAKLTNLSYQQARRYVMLGIIVGQIVVINDSMPGPNGYPAKYAAK